MKKLKDLFKPTFPKILLYVFLTFVVPSFVKVCSDNACNYEFKYFAGYKSLFTGLNGEFTLGMQILSFFIAYLFSALLISLFNSLKKRQRL